MSRLAPNVINRLVETTANPLTDNIEDHMLRHPRRYGLTTVEIEQRELADDRIDEIREKVRFVLVAALSTIEL
jgi:hypothetical protein